MKCRVEKDIFNIIENIVISFRWKQWVYYRLTDDEKLDIYKENIQFRIEFPFTRNISLN